MTRNRLRRRLRALLDGGPPPPPGRYLLGATREATMLSFPDLAAQLTELRAAWDKAAAAAAPAEPPVAPCCG